MRLKWDCGCLVWGQPALEDRPHLLGWEPCPLHANADRLRDICERSTRRLGQMADAGALPREIDPYLTELRAALAACGREV